MSARARPALSDQDRHRLEQIDHLVLTGEAAVPALIELLVDPSWAVRRAVVAGLASAGEAAHRALCRCLREQRDHEGRIAAAVDALVTAVGEVEHIVAGELLADPDPAILADAAQILGRRGRQAALPLLVPLLEHPDDNVALAALEALGRVGGRAAVDPLAVLVLGDRFFRVFPAIDVLGRSGDPRAIAPLTALLARPVYAEEAVRALGQTGERAAVAPLAALLCEAQRPLARAATTALAALLERHRDRYGSAELAERALRDAAPADTITCVQEGLGSATPDEQVATCRVLAALADVRAVPHLESLLAGPVRVAMAAVAALATLGRDPGPLLADVLRTSDTEQKVALLPLLGASALDALIAALDDEDAEVRTIACMSLARAGDVRAVPALFGRLVDADAGVSQAATAALQALGGPETEARARAAARSHSAPARRAALRILSYFGPPAALPLLLEGMNDPDPRVRDAALQGLPFVEAEGALEALLRATASDSPRTRAQAIRALGSSPVDTRAANCVVSALADDDAWVRYAACQSVARLGLQGSAAAMVERTSDPAGQVRVAAVEALARLTNAAASDALREIACASDPDIRRAALVGLGIGARTESLPLLCDALRSDDPPTRLVALTSLATFDSPLAAAALLEAIDDEDEGVRNAALGALAAQPGEAATHRLIGLLGRVPLRATLAEALALPIAGRVPALASALTHADDELAPLLASALARLGGTAELIALLAESTPPARRAIVTALGALGTEDAIAALRRAARRDPDAAVRRICAVLLGTE